EPRPMATLARGMSLSPRLAGIFRITRERRVAPHGVNVVSPNLAGGRALRGVERFAVRVFGHIRHTRPVKPDYRTGLPLLRWQFTCSDTAGRRLAQRGNCRRNRACSST